MRKTISLVLLFVMLLSLCSNAIAIAPPVKQDLIPTNTSLATLQADIIELISPAKDLSQNDLALYASEHSTELELLNERVNSYIENRMQEFYSVSGKSEFLMSKEDIARQKLVYINELLGYTNNVVPYSNAQYHDLYFEWSRYEYRNGYWTYSMVPKSDVRLLEIVAETAWIVLKDTWSISMGDDPDVIESLETQFMCHFHAKIEYEWNIEKGRPNVSMAVAILNGCNP